MHGSAVDGRKVAGLGRMDRPVRNPAQTVGSPVRDDLSQTI
jgi:hypothetical protein